ncbi:MAG: hypothetical protein MUF08_03970 [Burkholderiaceae bacterium]|nr:hypothetical protein [Burkholderiaceae bacterium]
MNTRPIRTEAEYKAALEEIASLMKSDPAAGTPDGDRLDSIVVQVQAYESRHHPIVATPPMQS